MLDVVFDIFEVDELSMVFLSACDGDSAVFAWFIYGAHDA